MNSSRPYLLRAFYEWIVDNNATPYIVVNADMPDVSVPRDYVDNGRIVLNISPGAVRALIVANDHVEFNARFAGVPHDIYVSMKAITAIYAKENGRGMVFKDDEEDEPPQGPNENETGGSKGGSGKGKKGNGRPKLTVVK
ncbi:MAG: ClpXP protease specificity-enhancing factor [Gammaproteobacteria bacterium 39-13]|nr:ClpXP protease specificity-enhancing factor [Gammaproteobacteria bacterium]OJV91532.1 MAG: ClpXP protease specificity-enhancing factor [Gammaproteobacteria bacterium 39-13]